MKKPNREVNQLSNSSADHFHALETLERTVNGQEHRIIGESDSEPVVPDIGADRDDLKALGGLSGEESKRKARDGHGLSLDFSISQDLKRSLKGQFEAHREAMSKFLAFALSMMLFLGPSLIFLIGTPTARAESNRAPVTYQTSTETGSGGVSVTFDRTLSGDRVGQHKAAPLVDVTMEISATVDNQVKNAELIDYYSDNWTMIDPNGGTVSQENENYKKIKWAIGTVTDSVSKTYVVKLPQRTIPPTDYYFQTELDWANDNATNDSWTVKVADPTESNYFLDNSRENFEAGTSENVVPADSGLVHLELTNDSGSWENLQNKSPKQGDYGEGVVGTGENLYVVSGLSDENFFSYNAADDLWNEDPPADTPKAPETGTYLT